MAVRQEYGIKVAWKRGGEAADGVLLGINRRIVGNKRVAKPVRAAFLRPNGYRLEFDDLEAYEFLIELYESGRMRFAELDHWLRGHVVVAQRPIQPQ